MDYLKELMWGLNVGYTPDVDSELCTGCGECAAICPTEVFEMREGLAVVTAGSECVGCENCLEVCEPKAIRVTEIAPQRPDPRHSF